MEFGNNDGNGHSASKPPVYYIVSASNYDRLKQNDTQSKDREFLLVRKQLSQLIRICADLVQHKPERAGSRVNKMSDNRNSHQRELSAISRQRRRTTSSARSADEFRRELRCNVCSLSNKNVSRCRRNQKEDMFCQLRRWKSLDFAASREQRDYHAARQQNEQDVLQYENRERLGCTSNISRISMIERNRTGACGDKNIANSGIIERRVEESDFDSCLDEDETSLAESILDWHKALKRVLKSTNILQIKLTNLGESTSESACKLERLRRETWQKMNMAEEVVSLLESGIHEDDDAKDKYLHLQED